MYSGSVAMAAVASFRFLFRSLSSLDMFSSCLKQMQCIQVQKFGHEGLVKQRPSINEGAGYGGTCLESQDLEE